MQDLARSDLYRYDAVFCERFGFPSSRDNVRRTQFCWVALALRENRSLALRRPEEAQGAGATIDVAAVKGIVGPGDLSLAMEKVCSKSDERFHRQVYSTLDQRSVAL